MPEASPPTVDRPALPGGTAQHASGLRTVIALVIREMSTTYGRSSLGMGYVWTILEPVAGIMLLTAVFALAFRAPSLGTNFPLFFASGMLPFMAYLELSQKAATAIRFSKQLLAYPRVTYLDALLARLLLNSVTNLMIMAVVIALILLAYDVDVIFDPMALAIGFGMLITLSAGVGTLNCYLLTAFPLWERAWAVLNRPLFFISGILFTFESVPRPYDDFLWWNPLVHVIGQVRRGIYTTYDAPYVSISYVMIVSLITLTFGLMLLRRYHQDLLNQ